MDHLPIENSTKGSESQKKIHLNSESKPKGCCAHKNCCTCNNPEDVSSSNVSTDINDDSNGSERKHPEHFCNTNVEFKGKNNSVNFKQTKAYSHLKEFIYKIDNSIKTEKQIEIADEALEKTLKIIKTTPLSNEPVRFANAGMKDVIDSIYEITDDEYLRESFGNKIRMDFGTGHELNFLCYLYIRNAHGLIPTNSIFSVLKVYFKVIRLYVEKFNIEAAGARGCWSVDDYQLLPFLFGSSENFSDPRHIDYIFNGVFREAWDHRQPTGMLKNICALGWHEINIGLLKMYDKEVLGKYVVTQHFIYSRDLSDDY